MELTVLAHTSVSTHTVTDTNGQYTSCVFRATSTIGPSFPSLGVDYLTPYQSRSRHSPDALHSEWAIETDIVFKLDLTSLPLHTEILWPLPSTT